VRNIVEELFEDEEQEEKEAPERVSPLQARDVAYYGYLCKLSGRIAAASGYGLAIVAVLIGVGACVALHVTGYGNWQLYAGTIVLTLFGWSGFDDILEKRIFRDEQQELQRRTAATGLSHDELVGLLAGDAEVESLYDLLKKQSGWSSS